MTATFRPTARQCQQIALAVALLVLVACDFKPPERPREGAPPIGRSTPVRLEAIAPPTLAPASSLSLTPTELPFAAPASPSPAIAASPVGSPGLYPIISSLLPSPGATLPPGDVVIGARITGSSDLVDIVAYVDGEAVPVDVGGQAVRTKVINLVRTLAAGSHEIRIQARDDHGQLGGYRWQFVVGSALRPPATTSLQPQTPLQTRTPLPVPTRRPLPTAIPTAMPRAAR